MDFKTISVDIEMRDSVIRAEKKNQALIIKYVGADIHYAVTDCVALVREVANHQVKFCCCILSLSFLVSDIHKVCSDGTVLP